MVQGTMRRLPYPLDYEADVQADTPADPPIVFQSLEGWPTDDPDERIRVVFDLSLNEYIALASSVDVGRDIAYGDNSLYIWWIWCRMVVSLSICEDIIQCINTDIGVQNALTSFLNPNSMNGDEQLTDRFPDASTTQLATLGAGCDLDELWGGTREIVVRLDDYGRDFLEDLANINDQIERIKGLIDLVPILGDFVADVGQFFTEAVPDLLTAYNAFSSEGSIDDIACQLFSSACEECRYPTFDEVFGLFVPLADASFPAFTLATMKATWDVVRSISSLNPETVWFTINAFQMFVLGLDATFFGNTGRKSISLWASLGEENSSDNWIVLCDGCGWAWTQNIVDNSQSPWTQVPGENCGVWVDGVGWEGTLFASDDTWRADLEISFDDANVNRITVTGEAHSRAIGNNFSIITYLDGSPVQRIDLNLPPGNFNRVLVLNSGAGHIIDQIRLRNIADDTQDKPITFTTIVAGTGTKPSQFP